MSLSVGGERMVMSLITREVVGFQQHGRIVWIESWFKMMEEILSLVQTERFERDRGTPFQGRSVFANDHIIGKQECVVGFEESRLYENDVGAVIREELDEFLFLTNNIIRVSKTKHKVCGKRFAKTSQLFYYSLPYEGNSGHRA